MATNCAAATKVEPRPCFRNFSVNDQKAILYYFILKWRTAVNGTVWADSTLVNNADNSSQYYATMTESDIRLAIMNIFYEIATDAGASIDTDPQALADVIADYRLHPDMDKLIVGALCLASNALD